MQGKHQKRRIRILVKALPQPSTKHEETVCCAGVTEDGRELLRLYPIRYRRLPKGDQYYPLYYPYQEVITLSSSTVPQAHGLGIQQRLRFAALSARAGSYPCLHRGKPAPTAKR